MNDSGSLKQIREETASVISQMGFALQFSLWPYRSEQDQYSSGIGLALEWNEGAKWYQPYLIVHLREFRYQLGWLYQGQRDEE